MFSLLLFSHFPYHGWFKFLQMPAENLHPTSSRLVSREDKENLLGQRGGVFWLFGLSGSGKSTLAIELERELLKRRFSSIVLDGDNLRSTISKDLGFSEEDRAENLRRASELARILVDNGSVVIVSFITPLQRFRDQAKAIIGEENYFEVYVHASFETCRERDVKGLYAKADKGEIESFTGKHSPFEPPEKPWLAIDTEKETPDESSARLLESVLDEISPSQISG